MKMKITTRAFVAAALALAASPLTNMAMAGPGHDDAVNERVHTMQEMMREHQGHNHEDHFEAMENVSPEHMRRDMMAMMELGLALPPMDSERGREVFPEKGCVACHAVNGVGGEMGPSFDAAEMPSAMNSFEFAARMWRGAPAMIALQEDLFGEPISLNGQELADIIAFVHDEEEQAKLTARQIPEEFRKLLGY